MKCHKRKKTSEGSTGGSDGEPLLFSHICVISSYTFNNTDWLLHWKKNDVDEVDWNLKRQKQTALCVYMQTYYERLQCDENATIEQIKKSYKQLALQTHPDKGGDVATFQKLQEAYNVLSDPVKRGKYDMELSNRSSSTTDLAASLAINVLMGGLQHVFSHINFNLDQPKKKCKTVFATSTHSFQDAIYGCRIEKQHLLTKLCPQCFTVCPTCKGQTCILDKTSLTPSIKPCTTCDPVHKGYMRNHQHQRHVCSSCQNTDTYEEQVTCHITIPPFTLTNGYRCTFLQVGEQPMQYLQMPGDYVLYCQVDIPQHVTFTETSSTKVLVFKPAVDFMDALCGCTIVLPDELLSLLLIAGVPQPCVDTTFQLQASGLQIAPLSVKPNLVLVFHIHADVFGPIQHEVHILPTITYDRCHTLRTNPSLLTNLITLKQQSTDG